MAESDVGSVEQGRGEAQRSSWRARFLAASWRHPGWANTALATAAVGSGLGAVSPLLLKAAVDDAVRGAVHGLPVLVAGLAGVGLLRFVATFLRQYCSTRLALAVQHDLRLAVVATLHGLDGAGQDRLRVGPVAFRTSSDVGQVGTLLALAPLAVGNVVLLVASVAAMLWLSPLLTVIALPTVPLWLVLGAAARRRLYPANRAAQQLASDLSGHLEETVTGVRVVKGFGQEVQETANQRSLALRLYRERMHMGRLTARFSPALTALPWLGLLAVFAAGGALAMRGQITVGTFLAYLGSLVGPVQVLANLVGPTQAARSGLDRVHELTDPRPATR